MPAKVAHMPVGIEKGGIGQKDTLPRDVKISAEGCEITRNHFFVISGIFKREAEGIIGLEEFVRV